MTLSVTLPHDGWLPRADQMPFWNALLSPDIRKIALAAHRRWGKDECCLHGEAIYLHQRVGTYWHALPQYGQSRKALWEAVNPRTGRRRIFDAFPAPLIEHIDEQSMRVRFKNNSVWQLVGSDNVDGLIGSSPIGITYSEAAVCDDTSFGLLRPILLENNGKEVYISTPRGRNTFHRIIEAYKAAPDAFSQVLSAHDTRVFTEAQLASERRSMILDYGELVGNARFAQEYLTSFEAAIVGAVFGEELAQLKTQHRVAPLAYDSRFPVDTSWDIGVRDETVILFWQMRGTVPHLIDWYSASDIGFEHFAEVMAQKPYFYGRHIGPHDVAERSKQTALSYAAFADRLGVRFERMPNTPKTEQIAAASILLKQARVNADLLLPPANPTDDCTFVLDMLADYRYSFDEANKVLSRAPVHNRSSHYADALMTYALYFVGNSTTQRSQHTQALQGRFDAAPPRLHDILTQRTVPRRGAFG